MFSYVIYKILINKGHERTDELKTRNLNSPEDQDNNQQFTLKYPNNKLDDPPYRTSYFNFLTYQFLMFFFKRNC